MPEYYFDSERYSYEIQRTDAEGYGTLPYYNYGEDTIYVAESDISTFNWADAG